MKVTTRLPRSVFRTIPFFASPTFSIGGGGRSTIGAKSLGTQFKENLNNLLGVVNLTHPHYVRYMRSCCCHFDAAAAAAPAVVTFTAKPLCIRIPPFRRLWHGTVKTRNTQV